MCLLNILSMTSSAIVLIPFTDYASELCWLKFVMFSQEEQDTIRLRWTNVNYEDERRLGLDGTGPLSCCH